MNVLIIDDDEVDRLTVARLIKGTDITLHTAASLREGLNLVATEAFDCALVDFQLGPETAFDFLSAAGQSAFATIVLTGYADEDLAIETLRHGAQDYLRKDELSRHLLLRAILYACERKGTVQQIKHLNAKLEAANANLRYLSQHDPLTGVLNRRGLAEKIEIEVQRARRTGSDMAVLFIDCDDFKIINDTHGHVIGDRVLLAVADVLEKTVRPTDYVARVGGDEFLVLLGNIRSTDAIVVAEKIEDGIRAQQVLSATGMVEISCSIGCCPLGGDDTSLDVIIHRAERALKQSKALGKDIAIASRLEVSAAETDGKTEPDLLRILTRLEDGTDLHVVKQPIIRLNDHAVVGYEFFVHGPPGEYERPDSFIQLALTANRGVAIDMACLRTARNGAREIREKGEWLVHVNLFPTTLRGAGITQVLEVLQEIRDLSGRRVCVELSERRFGGPLSDFRSLTERLVSEGMLLALDEVRLSRHGLETLLFLEPAFLKVDRHLMMGAHLDPGRFQTLQRLVALANRRSIQSVAVGIAGDGEWEAANRLGFDLGQGYGIGVNGRSYADGIGQR